MKKRVVKSVNKVNSNSVNSGFSLFEVLVVLVVFSIVAVLSTQSIFNTLRNSKKAKETAKVRANLEYAAAIMERHLRGAQRVECAPIDCDNASCVEFEDIVDKIGQFVCLTDADGGYIASKSADSSVVRLTSNEVNIACFPPPFTCSVSPDSSLVSVVLKGSSANFTGAEAVDVTVQTQVVLRNR